MDSNDDAPVAKIASIFNLALIREVLLDTGIDLWFAEIAIDCIVRLPGVKVVGTRNMLFSGMLMAVGQVLGAGPPADGHGFSRFSRYSYSVWSD